MKKNVPLVFMLLSPILIQAQGTFLNLDFEQATMVPLGGGNSNLYSALDALPGWTVYQGSNVVGAVLYNNLTLGSPSVSIHDPMSIFGIIHPLEGVYSVVIQSSTGGVIPSAIGQTGQLPLDSATLLFYAANYQNLEVSFADNAISYVQVGVGANYSILGADISSYAGQYGELRFTSRSSGFLEIDNIQFSSIGIPEPSTLTLFGLGALLLGWNWHRRNSR